VFYSQMVLYRGSGRSVTGDKAQRNRGGSRRCWADEGDKCHVFLVGEIPTFSCRALLA